MSLVDGNWTSDDHYLLYGKIDGPKMKISFPNRDITFFRETESYEDRNQKVCLTILAFAFALSGNGCFAPPSLSLPKHPEKLFVYEGLPHPFRERVLFEKERSGQENEEIHWDRFYSQKTEAKGRDRERLFVCFVRRGA